VPHGLVGDDPLARGDRALLPGFVDAHGHVVLGGLQALSATLLPPPDGTVEDIASL
jgi:predicted amidohydrolase YtcJ